MLLRPTDAEQLASFMQYVNSNIAKKIGRLVAWREKFWSRRYNPCDLPGPQSATAIVDGTMRLRGHWFDDTKAYWARQRGEELSTLSRPGFDDEGAAGERRRQGAN